MARMKNRKSGEAGRKRRLPERRTKKKSPDFLRDILPGALCGSLDIVRQWAQQKNFPLTAARQSRRSVNVRREGELFLTLRPFMFLIFEIL